MPKFVSGIEEILPKSLNYKELKKSLIKGQRKTVKLFPSSDVNSFSYNGNRIIQFNIPAKGFWDTKNTVICFEAFAQSPNGSSTSNLAFNNHIESVINKIQWKTGDGISSVENLTDYNVNLMSKFKYETSPNYGNSIAQIQEGYSDDVKLRNTWCNQGLPNPKGYTINLKGSGVMNSTLQYLPLSLLAMGGYSRALTLEITLEMPERCMIDIESSGQMKGYVLQNVFMQLEMIESTEYEKLLIQKVMNGELVIAIPYQTQDHWVNTIQPAQQGEITFQMNSYNEVVQGFRTVFINGASENVDFTNTFYRPLGIKNYQINIGNQYYPVQQVDLNGINSNAIQYNELLKYFNKLKDGKDGVLYSTLSSILSIRSISPVVGNDITSLTYSNQVLPIAIDIPMTITTTNLGSWDIDNTDTLFTPSISGFYNINAVINYFEYSTDTDTTDVQVFFGVVEGTNIVNNLRKYMTTKTVPVVLAADTDMKTITLSDTVYLTAGLYYSLESEIQTATLGNPGVSTYNLAISQASMSFTLVDTIISPYPNNFLIAQTFKTWYDSTEYMEGQNEFFIDGIDMTTTNQLVFKMNKNLPDNNQLSVFHYIDFIASIIISKDGVQLIK